MDNCAELTTAIPEELVDEYSKRLAYVSEGLMKWSLLQERNRVSFQVRTGFEPHVGTIARSIVEVADKLCLNYRPGVTRVLARREERPSSYDRDPHAALSMTGELFEFGRGRCGLGSNVLGLIEAIDRRVCNMAAEARAASYQFPSLIEADVLHRCRYLRNFPSSLNLVSHLREDLPRIQEFARSVDCEQGVLRFNPETVAAVECLLAPSVCFHWYRWLENSPNLSPRTITARGKCFRYESSNLVGLERLWDFTMREVIFVGEMDYVLGQRQKCIEIARQLLDELGLAYEITTATVPFFVDSYAVQAAFQQGFELKYEMLCPLPYNGKKLAVGSINYHQDFFGRAFNIHSGDTKAHTGCLGVGLERLALAVVAQYGPDPRSWPSSVSA